MKTAPSLEHRLLAWALAALLLVWAAFLAAGYATGLHEADELTDGQLASAAALLLSQEDLRFARANPGPAGGARNDLRAHDYQQSLSVVVWTADGHVQAHLGGASTPEFTGEPGYADLVLGDPPQRWRAYAQWSSGRDRLVMVLLSHDERRELAHDIAGQVAEPGLWLIPVVVLMLAWAIRQGLSGLGELTRQVAALDVARGQTLTAVPHLRELLSIEQAINTLVGEQTARLTREKRLADQLAHELRTPLAAISFQAQALQGPLPEAERQSMLAQIARDARRSGEVLSQVLALARTNRTALSEEARPVDLSGLVRRVVNDGVRRRHFPAERLQVLLPEGVWSVQGHEVLLEQALFNLVENAFAHGPAAGQVRVQLQAEHPGGLILRVAQDVPARNSAAVDAGSPGETSGVRPTSAAGLGLGHQLVERVAELHGGQMRRVDGPNGQSQAWELSLPRSLVKAPGDKI